MDEIKVGEKKESPPPPRRVRVGPIPFLDDPFRGSVLKLANDVIPPLGKNEYLSTSLVDYLLQKSLPSNLPNDIIVGSSNCMTYLQHYLKHVTMEKNRNTNKLQNTYQYYAMGAFTFLGIHCNQSHFFVISVEFDIRREDIFKNVKIYDSLRRTGRKVTANPTGKQFLIMLQAFLARYAFFASPNVESLLSDKEFILKKSNKINVLNKTMVTIVLCLHWQLHYIYAMGIMLIKILFRKIMFQNFVELYI